MDPKGSDCRVIVARSYEALPQLSGLQWSEVVPRPARWVST